MYSLTEVPTNHPQLQQLFMQLSATLGKAEPEPDAEAAGMPQVLLAIVAWHDGVAVGCGLLRREDPESAEIKRMYSRQAGVGSALLLYLEQAAQKQGFSRTLAAPRIINSKAVNFYLHKGYKKCAGYGKYRYSSQTICHE